MGTNVSLLESQLVVDPGSSVTTALRIRNTGDVVDQFTFQPLGDAAPWITVEPPVVRLFPQTDETVTVTIAPPRAPTSTPGVAHWAVKAMPQEDPDGASVAEGTVEVGTFADVSVELQPEVGHSRFRGRFEVAVDNRGNLSVPVRMTGTDAEQSLDFDIQPALVDCEPGTARFTKVKVRPAKRLWRGAAKTHAFELLAEPQIVQLEPSPVDAPLEPGLDALGGAGGTAVAVAVAPPVTAVAPPMTLTGTYVQIPIIPKWLWKAALLFVALMLVLWVLWQTLFKPTIESAAREVAVEEVEDVAEEVAAVDEKVDDAAVADQVEAAQTDDEIAALEETSGASGEGNGALSNVFNESTEPANFRLSVDVAAGAVGNAAPPPLNTDTTFALTDVILQNPRGDLGIISVQLGGVPIIESTLGNFRDLDFHFVAPYVADASTPLSIVVECDAVQVPADGGCSPAVSFSGFQTVSTPVGG